MNRITSLGNGLYEVTLYSASTGSWVGIQVNSELVRGPNMAKLTLDENAQGEAEIWPILFEKAYAEFLLGGWAEMKGGHTAAVWTALTGLPASTVQPAVTDMGIFLQIETVVRPGSGVPAGQVVLDTKSEFVDNQGNITDALPVAKGVIHANHAYVVRDIITFNGQTAIKLFNPWSNDHVIVYLDELTEITTALEILEPLN